LNEEFYETLQKMLDKVNKKDCIMLTGDMKMPKLEIINLLT